jgi:hypothetical protein
VHHTAGDDDCPAHGVHTVSQTAQLPLKRKKKRSNR